jgi:lipoprotein-releasing system ATP-binding protein
VSARPVVEARAVSRDLGEAVKTRALSDVDLVVAEGEFVALTGHSGSGKSTLLYLLGVLDRPTEGAVLIDGIDTGALDDDDRARLRNEKLGFVFQFHFLLPEFTAVENVAIPMRRRGLDVGEAVGRANETLRLLGLEDLARRRPGQMSGGQQQRVSIARAVANEPRLLLADEPTGNLDSQNAELVIELFERMNRELGMAVVMVTHDDAFARRAARHVRLKDGRIIG